MELILVTLSTDLKIRGLAAGAPSSTPVSSGSGSFAQVLSAACQTGGGTDYEKYFQLAADTYDVPVNLIKAVAKAESNFDASAVSRCGAQGVMQLMPATARAMGVTDSFDPAQNIMGGTKYLRQMLDTFDGDVSKAIAAYNAGPNAVKKHGGVPYQGTKDYVDKVLSYAGENISAIPTAAAGREDVPVSGDSLAQDELADLVLQAYYSGGTYNQEYMRMLLHQMFLQNVRDNEEWELNVSI